jgi:hypothetical protein
MLTASSCIERYAELVDRRYERIRWGAASGAPKTREAPGSNPPSSKPRFYGVNADN